jgi:UDP-N-acetylmuramate--alanine ligase
LATVIDYTQYLDLDLVLHQPGLHNRLNAATATAVATYLGIDRETTNTALENFAGTWRRFEYKGLCNNARVYDDYAHHPTEIRASIAGVRERYPDKKITVVFQSHTYTRTAELFDNFVRELEKADRVVMIPIYSAREVNISGVTSEQLVEALTQKGTEAHFFHTHKAAGQFVKDSVGKDDVVVVMGAGDVTEVADFLTK